MIRLYGFPYSPYTEFVHCLLLELGLDFQFVLVDLSKGEHLSEKYKETGLFSRVPSLKIKSFCLSESKAMARYLSRKYQAIALYPENIEDAAYVDMWMDFVMTHIGQHLSTLAWERHYVKTYKGETSPGRIVRAEKHLKRNLETLEERLFVSGYIVNNDDPMLSDFALLPHIAVHSVAGVSLDEYPFIKSWYERMKERESWKLVLKNRKSVR